jgi:hypothetical protein
MGGISAAEDRISRRQSVMSDAGHRVKGFSKVVHNCRNARYGLATIVQSRNVFTGEGNLIRVDFDIASAPSGDWCSINDFAASTAGWPMNLHIENRIV